VLIDGRSETRDIKFGQTYKLASWADSSVGSDSSLPHNAFGFSNGVQAVPIVYMALGDHREPSAHYHKDR